MAQAAKKHANHQASVKSASPVNPVKLAPQPEEIVNIGRNGIEEMLREADNISRIAHECMGACTDTLCAGIESGDKASRVLREAGDQLMKNINRAFSENGELFKEALSCRTMNDIAKWHADAWRTTADRYFDEANAMWELLFDGCAEAIEPLQEQASIASENIHKVLEVKS